MDIIFLSILSILGIFFVKGDYFYIKPQYPLVTESVEFECSEESNDIRYDMAIDGTDCLMNCEILPANEDLEICQTFHRRISECSLHQAKLRFVLHNLNSDDFKLYRCRGIYGLNQEILLEQYEPCDLRWKDRTFIYKENEEFTIQCRARNCQPPSKELFLQISGDDHMNCTSVRNTQTCSVTSEARRQMNGAGVFCEAYQLEYRSAVNITETLNITYPPNSASVNDSEVHVMVEESVVLNCYVDTADSGNPHNYIYTWARNNDASYNETTSNGQLAITAHDECWNDIYKCCPKNIAGSGRCGDIFVNVTVPATAVVSSEIHTIYFEHNLDLICTCAGKPPPAVQWTIFQNSDLFYWNSTHGIPSGECMLSTSKTATLMWSEIEVGDRQLANGDTVTCTCQNSDEETSTANVSLNVQFPPGKASITTTETRININETLKLACLFSPQNQGNPDDYEYMFYLNGTSLLKFWTSNHEKEILITAATQEGEYKCRGRNKPDATDPKPGEISDNASVTIYVVPEITNPLKDTVYTPSYNDGDFTIQCGAFGKPDVEIKLHRNGVVVGDEDFSFQVNYEHNVDLPYGLEKETKVNFTWNINKTGNTCSDRIYYDSDNFTCIATNEGTQIHEVPSGRITIQTKYPPTWNGSDYDFYAELNTISIDIYCNICSSPPPSFCWAKDTIDNILEDENNHVLTLYDVSHSDFGIYICVAENEIGASAFEIFLKVDGAPQLTNFGIVDKTSMSLTVSWNVYSDGGHPPVHFKVLYRRLSDDSYIEWSDDLHYNGTSDKDKTFQETITQLNATSLYQVLVEARNIKKTENITKEKDSIQTLAQPELELQSAKLDGKVLTVTWTYESADFGATIESNYQITVRVRYWHQNSADHVKLYPAGDTVAASEKQITFHDNDLTTKHIVGLLVYENGMLNELISDGSLAVESESSSIGAGPIAGIVIALTLIAVVIVTALLVRTGQVKLPFLQNHQSNATHAEQSDSQSTQYESIPYVADESLQTGNTTYTSLTKDRDADQALNYQNLKDNTIAENTNNTGNEEKSEVEQAISKAEDDIPYEIVENTVNIARLQLPLKDLQGKPIDPSSVSVTWTVDADNFVNIKLDGYKKQE